MQPPQLTNEIRLPLLCGRIPCMLIFIAVLGVLQFILQVTLLNQGIEFVTVNLTPDDAYYYLETAWNHSRLGFPTFDGDNATNGFHPLWYVILVVESMFLSDKYDLLLCAIVTCSLFNALSYIFIYKISNLIKSDIFPLLFALVWFCVNVSDWTNLSLLENSLHALVSIWIIYELISLFIRLQEGLPLNALRITAALILNVYSRIDAGFVSAVIYIALIVIVLKHYGGIKKVPREITTVFYISSILAILSALFLFITYYFWGGTFLSVSGIVKNSGIFPNKYPGLEKPMAILKYSLPKDGLFFLAPISFIMMIYILIRHRGEWGILLNVYNLLLLSSVFYFIFLWLSPATNFHYWYFSSVKTFWFFSISFSIYYFLDFLRNKRPIQISVIFLIFVVSLVGSVNVYIKKVNKEIDETSLYSVRYHVAKWINENLPDARIASWNAGQLGYFTDNVVVNLDGLINSKGYYNNVLRGNQTLSKYLRMSDVQFVVDYMDRTHDKFTNALKVKYESDPFGSRERTIKIWIVDSNIDETTGIYPKLDR